jgi:soluble lytic murein transglycosylase-like protein
MDGVGSPPLRSALAGATLAFGLGTPAFAQVIEVGPSGASTIAGPSIFTAQGASPIQPKRPKDIAKSSRHLAAAPLIEIAGADVKLSPRLIEAVAYVESRFNPQAVSPDGAVGVMQLMPATAAELGVDPANPEANIRGGADYLRRMVTMFGNNLELALAAYNAGPSAVLRYGGVPPYAETRAYIGAVMDYLATSTTPETD